MKNILKILSMAGLVVLLVSPLLELAGSISATSNKWGICIGTVIWFATAPFWIHKNA